MAAACAALCAASPAALDIKPLWTAEANMVMEGAPIVVDLDGDGAAEVLAAAYENIIVVDGSGHERWRFDTRGRYSTCPAVLERADAPALIFAGDNTGLFTCLDGAGAVVWQAEIAPVFCSGPALADLDGDSAIEVIQGDKSGAVSVFDALTGAAVWKKSIDGECSSPAVGDLDGDGTIEIVIATGAGKVFALDAHGEVRWELALGGTSPDWATCSPILFADSAGRVCVAAASPEQRFCCIDAQGELVWQRPTRGAVASTISAGDPDGDGRADLFVVTQLGVLYRFDEAGRVIWDIDTQGRSLASGAILDLDGDGTSEYVLCTQQGNLLVFNESGEVVFNHQFDNRTINVTPAFGDIVVDRPGLAFAITGGESGRIFCFGAPAAVDVPAQWRTYRCDNRLTGAWLGLAAQDRVTMTPENLNWDLLLTGDDVTFRIANPSPGGAPMKAEAACLRPDGSRQAAVGVVTGARGLLTIPVSIPAPGVYRFEWSLRDSAGEILAKGSRELTLTPYRNDEALARRAALALRAAIEGAGGGEAKPMAVALRREAEEIEAEVEALTPLQAAAPGAEPEFGERLDLRTAVLNVRSKRALALADVARTTFAEAPGASLMVFEGTTWENRDVDRQLPAEAANPLRIERRCIVGEHEPVSVKVFSVTINEIEVGVDVESDAITVTPYEVKPVPTNQGTTAWDPIQRLHDNRIAVPSLETREIWLDIDLGGVAAGTHTVRVRLNGGGQVTEVEIVLDVLPFEMAGPGAVRLCCWATYDGDAVEDLLRHGNTVFITGFPSAGVADGDAPRIEIDFTALDAFLAPLASHDVFLLMSGIPALGVPMEEEAYVPRFAAYIDEVLRHLAERGVDEDRVALYPYDEPGGQGWDTVNHFVAFARQAKAARPGLKFYVNGGGDLPMLEALNEVASIWCPGFYALPESTPEMEFIRHSGKTLWSYDCGYAYARPIGANTKTINVVAEYRLAAPFALSLGAMGLGFWCYNVGPSMWDPIRDEYPIVYGNADGTHTSCRRWEAVREGMEDARILIGLREKLADESVDAAIKDGIRRLLDETLPGVTRQTLGEARLGVARYVLDASNSDDTVGRFRGELMECVASLSAATP